MATLETLIKTPNDLKFWHLEKHPDSHFFDRKTLQFFGDTMANYGLKKHSKYYELLRKRPVKHGLFKSHFFDRETLEHVTNPVF